MANPEGQGLDILNEVPGIPNQETSGVDVPPRQLIEKVPGVPGSSAVAPVSREVYWGGYTGHSLSGPILGLPESMSAREAHVLAIEQNANKATEETHE